MTCLADEILTSISQIQECAYDAEIRIAEALMEDTMKQIKMEAELSRFGVIQEGDIIPERNGENIFKYIFLWIPRVIINICKKIKQWWNNKKKANIDAVAKEAEEKKMQMIISAQQEIMAKVGDPRFVPFGTSAFGYLCKTKDFNAASNMYEEFANLFENYEQLFYRITESDNNLGFKDVLINFANSNTVLDSTKLTSGEPEYVHKIVPGDDFIVMANQIAPVIKDCSNRATKAMERVLDKRDEIERRWIKFSKHQRHLATRFADEMTEIYKRFQALDVTVRTDIDSAQNAIRKFEAYWASLPKDKK